MAVPDAIVQPFSLPPGQVGRTVLLVSNQTDLRSLCSLFQINEEQSRPVMMSRLYPVGADRPGGAKLSLLGPVIGAPYAAMLAEVMIASGARKIVFFGWCGSISADIKTGDVFIPDMALVDEGVSADYLTRPDVDDDWQFACRPCSDLTNSIKKSFKENSLNYSQGTVWSTSAVFRETPAKVKYFQQQQALVVEMETSAIFSVAFFRGVSAAAVLVVSDELSTLIWKPGFMDKRFINQRQSIVEILSQIWSVK